MPYFHVFCQREIDKCADIPIKWEFATTMYFCCKTASFACQSTSNTVFWTIYRFFGGTRTHIIWLVYIFAMHLQDFRFGWVHKYGPKIHVSDTNIYLTKTGLDDLNKYGPSWVSIGKGMSNIVRLADTSSSSWYEIEQKSKLIFSRYGGNLPYLVPQTCPTILSLHFWGFRVSNLFDQILWALSSSAVLSSL